MSKLLDEASKEMRMERYGGVLPKPMEGYPRERLEYLWDDMLAKGIFHVFAGDSGIGKTLILCDIAAIVSRGGIFPGQIRQCTPGGVIYLSGEDAVKHTLGPRLEAAGADMSKVIEWPTTNNAGHQFDLARDLGSIEQYIMENGNVSLFIIDPVTAFCGGTFDNDSVTSVRHLTTKLNDLADSTGVAIIALQHLTKSENPKLKNRILGSGAWVHGPRIVLGAVHTQENDRLFGKIKANVTDTYGVYPFSIESVDIQDIEGVRRIDWADEAWCNDQLSDHECGLRVTDSKSQLAYDILRESLSDGQWHLRDFLMQRILSIVEVSESTVKRMAQELGIEKRRISDVPPQTEWRLSKQSIPGHNI